MCDSSSVGRARLLIIDDNPSIHEDIRKVLTQDRTDDGLRAMEAALFDDEPAADERPSYRIDAALSGQEGVELARRAIDEGDGYRVAFVDMRMPNGWGGLETIERLWQVDRQVRTVVCTAYSDHSWSEICQRLGDTHRLRLLKKPFGNLELQQLVGTLTE